MIFKLIANAELEAKNIDDAFKVLSKYFTTIAETGLEIESIFSDGKIEITKIVKE